jgi:hypothetical protein
MQTTANIFSLAIDVRVNLVRHAPVAFVFGEADVMSSRTHPHGLSVPCEWHLPQTEVMPARDHGDGFSLLVTEVLDAAQQVERAHRRCQVSQAPAQGGYCPIYPHFPVP